LTEFLGRQFLPENLPKSHFGIVIAFPIQKTQNAQGRGFLSSTMHPAQARPAKGNIDVKQRISAH
jgi:hypothetical protein